MQKLVYFFICISLFSLIFISCEKDDNNGKRVNLVDTEMKEYFASYNKGSWWTYINESDSFDKDSVFISQYEEIGNWESEIDANQTFNLYYDCQKTQDFRTTTRTENANRTIFNINNSNSHRIYKENREIKSEFATPTTLEKFDSLELNNFVFKDVLKIRDPNSFSYETFYFAKNIGIIRKETSTRIDSVPQKIYNIVKWEIK